MIALSRRQSRSATRTRKELTTVHRLHNRWITAYIRELRKPNCSRQRLAYCVDRMCILQKVTAELERQLRVQEGSFVGFLESRLENTHPERGSSTLLSALRSLVRQIPRFA